MKLIQKIKKKLFRLYRILRATLYRKGIHLTRKIILPGFEGISLYEILFFFIWSIKNGLISTRASSLAFHFFLALIPFGLVVVVSSAYIPFFDLHSDIVPILKSLVPNTVIDGFIESMEDFEHSSVNSAISIGFIMAIYFTSNGFTMLIKSFNSSRIKFKKRSWFSAKAISLLFVFGFIITIISIFLFLIYERKFLLDLSNNYEFVKNYYNYLFYGTAFLVIGAVLYFGIAILYYLGPSDRSTFKFMSAGATLTTSLVILITLGYSFYISNFSNYSALYGSAGTIIILLIWIYMNSFALLIGFELNASIHGAIMKKKLETTSELKQKLKTEENLN